MVVLSLLRSSSPGLYGLAKLPACGSFNLMLPSKYFLAQIRMMSEKRHMIIQPSRFSYTKFKDQLHFYILLGVIPLGILTFCVNVFIGPAELAEIPEDYVPKHWEYYRHPFQRFIARYIYPNPQQEYEKYMHYLQVETEKTELRLLESKVYKLMGERNDYKAWYFRTFPAKYYEYARKTHEDLLYQQGQNN